MERDVRDGMELDITGQHIGAAAFNLNRQDLPEDTRLIDQLAKCFGIKGDAEGLFTVTIDDGRNKAVSACRPGGPLTGPVALDSAEFHGFCHGSLH